VAYAAKAAGLAAPARAAGTLGALIHDLHAALAAGG
jgi:hypothetical protein